MTLATTDSNPATTDKVLHTPFVVAVALLGVGALLAGPVTRYMDIKQIKKELPLRSPLGALASEVLQPYRVVERQILEPTMVETLGTEQYISWLLEDTSRGERDPMRVAHLFITYYSGGREKVPHTPDVCYLGSGYRPARPHENIERRVSSLAGRFDEIPLRVLTFQKTAVHDHRQVSVVYTFFVNGTFAVDSRWVRVLLNNLQNHYAFFSKVEVSFPFATREETIDGAARLLDTLLPILIERHWPDFEEAERAAKETHASIPVTRESTIASRAPRGPGKVIVTDREGSVRTGGSTHG